MTQYLLTASSHLALTTPSLSFTPAHASNFAATELRRVKVSHTRRSRAASREERGGGGFGRWSEGFDLRFGIGGGGGEGQHSWSASIK